MGGDEDPFLVVGGQIVGQPIGVDIDPFLTNPSQTFRFVRITDVATGTVADYNSGADIDARMASSF